MAPYTYLKVPTESWDILAETLEMDSTAGNFDAALRNDISRAFNEVEVITAPVCDAEGVVRIMLEDIYHQLSTDSDLETQVSAPEKYALLTQRLRVILASLDSTQVR
jgi:hypothetical protein